VAWSNFTDETLMLGRLDAAGHAVGAARTFRTAFPGSARFDLAWDGSAYVLAFEDELTRSVLVQRLDVNGNDVGTATVLTTGSAQQGDLTHSVRVSGAEGEVLVALDRQVFRLRGADVSRFAVNGDQPVARRFGNTYLVLAVFMQGVYRGGFKTYILDESFAVTSSSAQVIAGGITDITLVANATGATVLARLDGIPTNNTPRGVQVWALSSRGVVTDTRTLSTSINPLAAAKGGSARWLLYADDRRFVRAARTESSGAEVDVRVPTPDNLESLSVADSAQKTLVVWVASPVGTTPSTLEGQLITSAGGVTGVCP
jgi:hypothetical protein